MRSVSAPHRGGREKDQWIPPIRRRRDYRPDGLLPLPLAGDELPEGLLPEPARPPGGIRRYGGADVRRVKFIKSAQRLGFSLDEIGELLRLEDGTHCSEARELAERKLGDVRGKLADLLQMESVLSSVVCACHGRRGTVSCPLIETLQQDAPQPRALS